MIILIVLVIGLILFFSFRGVKNNENNNDVSAGSSNVNNSSNYTQKGGVNNPGYLIHRDDINWAGHASSDGCKFENFLCLDAGIRAWYINLFGKVKNGSITNTDSMIDILTPASAENSEIARNNYKNYVRAANNWVDLGIAVFNFENNPSWEMASEEDRQRELDEGFQAAVAYRYGPGNVPPYFNS